MTPDTFRRLALALPQAEESAHQGHPDFRVGGKVFATLGYPGPEWAMVKLDPETQQLRVEAAPTLFTPVTGAWGRGGATNVRLDFADEASVRGALTEAWRRSAPKRMLAELP